MDKLGPKPKSGTVLETNKNGILVKARKGLLLIEELQLEGKRRMTAEEFLAGHKQLSRGTILK